MPFVAVKSGSVSAVKRRIIFRYGTVETIELIKRIVLPGKGGNESHAWYQEGGFIFPVHKILPFGIM